MSLTFSRLGAASETLGRRRLTTAAIGAVLALAAGVWTAEISSPGVILTSAPIARMKAWLGAAFARETAKAPIEIDPKAPPVLSPLDAADPSETPSPTGLSADRARTINAGIPFARGTLEAARPFVLASASPADRQRAVDCLTQAVYYEAGFEPMAGRQAVAQVVLNRVRHPAFPKSVCGVVYQGASKPVCQFSFVCDGALGRPPNAAAWATARQVAVAALSGHVVAAVGQATHYHTDWVAPYWGARLAKLTQIGAHIFYRWPGDWGRRAAFTGGYTGREPVPQAFFTAAAAPAAAAATLPPELDPAYGPPERRAPNDLGGRIDPTLGWTPSVPLSPVGESAMAKVLAGQGPSPAAAVTAAADAVESQPAAVALAPAGG